MSSTSPVVLILGSGSNVGQHVARAFRAKGYKIAHTARRIKEEESTQDEINITSDLSDPASVVDVFSKVNARLGLPSVVIYNAGASTRNDPKRPLSLPLADFTRDLNINTTSAFVAAQQAAAAFERLPDSASRTFIFTGNVLNTKTMPPLMDMGVGKSATAHMIQSAAAAYADNGFKFYYADERKPDGSPSYTDIDGKAHGEYYLQLSENKTQGPWQQTFVKGIGYKSF